MALVARQIGEMSSDSKRTVGVSFTPPLRGNEVLSGTPTVSQLSGPAGGTLTLDNARINTDPEQILGVNVDPFKAVLFDAESDTTKGEYVVQVGAQTNAGQRFRDKYRITVK